MGNPKIFNPGVTIHAEKAADDADADAQDDQSRPEDFHARDGHEHIQPVHAVTPFLS